MEENDFMKWLSDYNQGKNKISIDSDTSYGLFDDLLGSGTLNGVSSIANIGMGLWQMSQQGDMMDMYKDKLNMAKEQWGLTKEEMARIAKVRTNVQQGYQNGGNYAEQARRNPSDTPSKYLS